MLSAGSSAARSYPVSLVLSGYYSWRTGYVLAQNTYGVWWTSSVQSASTAYYTIVIDDQLTQNSDPKYVGHSLRCKNSGLFPAGSSAARSYPVSLVYSGNYNWRYGELDNEEKWGHWWSLYTYSDEGVIIMNTGWSGDTKYLNPQNSAYKEYGFSLRWL